MNRRKSIGPSFDPLGTPLSTGTLSDELPSTTTLWVWPYRKDAQVCMLPRTLVFKFLPILTSNSDTV